MSVATVPNPSVGVLSGDPAALSDDRLAAEISTLAGHLAAALCRWLLLVAEFDRREAWGAWDCRSCAHWLSWRCGMDLRTAYEHIRVAHALERLPLVRERFASGELSYSKVRAITRVAVEPYEEEYFVNYALNATAPMLERAVRGYRRSGQIDDQSAADRHLEREFHWWIDLDGMVCFQGRMAPEDARIVIAAIEAATVPATRSKAERPVDDARVPLPQPGDDPKGARQADALVQICETALLGHGEGEGTNPGLVAEPTATVVVHIDEEVLATDADGASRLADGPNLSPETVRRIACDATTYTIAAGPDGKQRLVDHAYKTVSPTLRREVAARDGGHCRFPGCDLHGRLHAHHMVHREHHGPNVVENLITLCAFHHRLVHERGYRVELLLDQVIVHRPDGARLVTTPPEPASGPDLETLHHLAGLTVGQETIVGHWDGTRVRHDDLSWSIAFLNAERERHAATGDPALN